MMPAFQRMVAFFHPSIFIQRREASAIHKLKTNQKKTHCIPEVTIENWSILPCLTVLLSHAHHFAPSIPRNDIRAHIVMILQFFILKSLVSLHLKQLNQECFVIRIIGVDFGGCAVAIVCALRAIVSFIVLIVILLSLSSVAYTHKRDFFIIQKDLDSLPSSMSTEEKLSIFWNASIRWVTMTRIFFFTMLI